MQGWFIAPETSQYRFHMACDDHCDFYMGTNISDPLNITHLAARRSYSGKRSYLRLKGGDVISPWVNLTKD